MSQDDETITVQLLASETMQNDEPAKHCGRVTATLGAVSLLGGAIYGYNVAASAYLTQVKTEFQLSEAGEELVSSAATVSDAASMLIVGALFLDTWGRRNTVAVGAAFSVLGCMLGFISNSLFALVFGRFLQGVGNGISILAVPMLVSESSSSSHRGFLVSLFQAGVVTGFTIPYGVQLGWKDWRTTYVTGCIPGIGLLVALSSIWSKAESKSWLAAKQNQFGSRREADSNRNTATEVETSTDSLSTIQGLSEEQLAHLDELNPNQGLVNFTTGSLLAVVLAFTNNSSDAIIFYGPQILEKAGIMSDDSLWTAFALSAINIPAALLVLVVIHRFPRRGMFLIGLGIISVCYLLIGLLFSRDVIPFGVIFTLFLLLLVSFQAGPGTLFVVVLPELFTQSNRAKGMAIGTAAMSAFSLLCNGTMLSTISALGPSATFLVYGVLYTACFCILYKYLPESKHVIISH